MSAQPKVGRLCDVPLPLLLRECGLRKLSGVLDLHQEQDQRRILLVSGEVRSARSNRMEQRFGQHCVRTHAITQPQVDQALANPTPGITIGRKLVQLGFLTQESLSRCLKQLFADIIIECMRWNSGEWRFYEGAPVLAGDVEIRVSTADLVFRGIRQFASEELARKLIGNLDAPLVLNPSFRQLLQEVEVEPAAGAVLARISGPTSSTQLLRTLPGDSRRNLLTLAAFVACGLVTVKGVDALAAVPAVFPPVAAAKAARAAAAGGQKKPAPGSAIQTRLRALRKLPRRPTGELKLSADDVVLLRRTIENKYQGLGRFTHYQLLDLPSAATQKEIHYSFTYGQFFYHPDLAKRKEFADLKAKLEAIFARLEEAYYTLVDVEKRKKYDRGHGY